MVLARTVTELMVAGLAPSTHKAYATGIRTLRRFTALACPSLAKAGMFPVLTENLLNYFVAHCYRNLNLRYTTIKLYLAGVRHAYITQGCQTP